MLFLKSLGPLIYRNSPVFLQNAAVVAMGYANTPSRYGREYWEHRRWLHEFDSWNLDQKCEWRDRELNAFVRFAAAHSPYYTKSYAGIDLAEIVSPANLEILPILKKEVLRSFSTAIKSNTNAKVTEWHTGGTTGKSMVGVTTHQDQMRRMALLDHFKARHGFEHREAHRASFSGKHIIPSKQTSAPYWRYNHACRQMIYSSFNLSRTTASSYVQSLNAFKPKALDGFFSTMCFLADRIERDGLDLQFRPIAIFPTAETVTDEGRNLLERVFEAPVVDQYASSEGAPFVTQCRAGKLHVEMSSGIFENFMPGSIEVLVTSFTTHGMPLIRYQIGDSIEIGELQDCSCGVSDQMVRQIQGRASDFLVRRDGGLVNLGMAANMLKSAPNSVTAAQFIQSRHDSVVARLVVDGDKYDSASETIIRREMEQALGPNMNIMIELVESIPREASGKVRLVKNELQSY